MYIGSAGWQLPKCIQSRFPGEGTHLARYARHLTAVEINSSFYRRHRRALYEKWASEVPADFRFAVKIPRTLTHHQRLRSTDGLEDFLEEVEGLGRNLGPLLLQLPPSLAYEPETVNSFLVALRNRFDGSVVCEPRHQSWFAGEPDKLLRDFAIARAAVDPPPWDAAQRPGGWTERVYYRLHGQPRRFYSAYDETFLKTLAKTLAGYSQDVDTWCIFNNTATEAGLGNALALRAIIERPRTQE